jgi:hypothetical protein
MSIAALQTPQQQQNPSTTPQINPIAANNTIAKQQTSSSSALNKSQSQPNSNNTVNPKPTTTKFTINNPHPVNLRDENQNIGTTTNPTT